MAKLFPFSPSHSSSSPPPRLDRSPVFDLAPRVLPHQPYPDGPDDLTDARCGTVAFSAPEIRVGRAYTYGVDFWSVGVVVCLMLTERFPFGPMGEHSALSFKPGEVDEHAERFLGKMLDINPSARPDIHRIKADPFFASIDWDDIAHRTVPAPFVPHEPTYRLQKKLRIPLGSPYPDAASDPRPDFSFASAQFAAFVRSHSVPADCPNPSPRFLGLRNMFSGLFRMFRKGMPTSSAGDMSSEGTEAASSASVAWKTETTAGAAGSPWGRFRAWLR
ncbi:kinase-like protein [Dentipellis sp. KUC8613]|nr:kinase-like protein [Dentipellis sp. KUC8613]